MKMICAHCNKVVYNKAKIDTIRLKLGNKILSQVNYYHKDCFTVLHKERSRDEHREKERNNKGKNSR